MGSYNFFFLIKEVQYSSKCQEMTIHPV